MSVFLALSGGSFLWLTQAERLLDPKYSNSDGSYYYSNPNGSTYHNDGSGGATYTGSDGNGWSTKK